MENKTQYLEDISQIRTMMERSSRFISLSGLSGIFAGLYALVGAHFANDIITNERDTLYNSSLLNIGSAKTENLVLIAVGVLFLAVTTGIILTTLKAKRNGLKNWDATAKRLMINLLIPLAAGGILCLIFLYHGLIGIVAPCTLVFYGLGLVNASPYTFSDIRYLGFMEIILGLISAFFVGYGLYFWAAGFGILHILYGAIMYFKYER